jgi:hypothetical protein
VSAVSSRRALLRAVALAPVVWLLQPRRVSAKDYAGPAEVMSAIDALEGDVAGRLSALAAAVPAARTLVASFLADQARHREVRADVRRMLHLPVAAPSSPSRGDTSLEALRTAQEALVYAHAEGLPALGAPAAVDALARNMIDLARHLTVLDLWIEAEAARG